MTDIQFKLSAVRQTKWYEYLIRFVFGGLITVGAGLVAQKYGPVVGGLFLAFPSIFPASVTLVQSHKKEQERQDGEPEPHQERQGREAAGITAEGAALGGLGLLAFAIILWQLSTRIAPWLVLVIAMLVWILVNVIAWLIFHQVHPQQDQEEASS